MSIEQIQAIAEVIEHPERYSQREKNRIWSELAHHISEIKREIGETACNQLQADLLIAQHQCDNYD